MNKVTVDTLKEIIERERDIEQKRLIAHHAVGSVLEQNEGKQISKRIATKVKEHHADWNVRYIHEYGLYYIGITIPEYEEFKIHIGHDSNPVVDMVRFGEIDAANGGAAAVRNLKRQQLLNSTKQLEQLAKLINDYNNVIPVLGEILSELPDSSYIRELFDSTKIR